MPISKTDFIRGLQCEKMLWLDAHKPEEKIIPQEVQQRLDQGNEFGDKAMGIFGDFVETTAFKEDGRLHYAQMIKTTLELLSKNERVICEGAFSWLGNFCAADILKKDENCYSLYEVKNSTALKKEFLLDLAFQRMIIQKCNIPLGDCFLILNGNKIDEENAKGAGQVSVERVNRIEKDGFCFDIFCVTKQVCLLQKQAEKKLFPLGKIKKKDAPMPTIFMGEQCQSPYPCWYVDFCKKCENENNLKNNE